MILHPSNLQAASLISDKADIDMGVLSCLVEMFSGLPRICGRIGSL